MPNIDQIHIQQIEPPDEPYCSHVPDWENLAYIGKSTIQFTCRECDTTATIKLDEDDFEWEG